MYSIPILPPDHINRTEGQAIGETVNGETANYFTSVPMNYPMNYPANYIPSAYTQPQSIPTSSERKYWIKKYLGLYEGYKQLYDVYRGPCGMDEQKIMQCETDTGNLYSLGSKCEFTVNGASIGRLRLKEVACCGENTWSISTPQQQLGDLVISGSCCAQVEFGPYFSAKITNLVSKFYIAMIVTFLIILISMLFPILTRGRMFYVPLAVGPIATACLIGFYCYSAACPREGGIELFTLSQNGQRLGRAYILRRSCSSDIADVEISCVKELDGAQLMGITSLLIIGFLNRNYRRHGQHYSAY